MFTKKLSFIRRSMKPGGIGAKTLRRAALAVVCSGLVTLGAQASHHSSDHLDAVVFDGGFSSRGYGYSKYGYSGLGYSGKKYGRSKYYYGNSFRSGRGFKGSKGFSRGSRFGGRRGFRSSRY